MPSTHSEFLKVVCGCCLRKSKHIQSITPGVLELIRKHHHGDYSLDEDILPHIVCKSCVSTLKEINKVISFG